MIICNLSPWMHANALSSAMSKNHVIDKAESAEFLTLPKPPLPTCWRSQNSPRYWVQVNPPNGLCLVSKPSILGSTKANFLALIHPFCGVWSFWLIATSTYRHISICVPSRSTEHWKNPHLDELNCPLQAAEPMENSKLWIVDKWAIKNTPIPSHYTSWLIGFATMGYHNPQ